MTKRVLIVCLCIAMVLMTSCGGGKEPIEKEIYAKVSAKTLIGTYEYSDYVVNEKGQIIEFVEKAKYGTPVTHQLEYDEDGHLVSENCVGKNGYEKYNYVYNSDGLVEREYASSDWSLENGKEFTYTYTFNDKGEVETKTEKNINVPDYETEYSYVYDSDGRVSRKREYNKSSGNTYITDNVYDEHGNLIEEHVSTLNNSNGSWVNYYEYECIGTYTVYE